MRNKELRYDIIQYFIKTPKEKGRASFSLQKRVISPEGKRSHVTVEDERIDVLNAQYRAEEKDFAIVKIELDKIRDELYEQEKRRRGIWVPSEENAKIVENYWERQYSTRDIDAPQTARYDIWRAVRSIGNLSLASASEHDFRKAIKNNLGGDREKQRKAIPRIRALLKFIGRSDVILHLPKKLHVNEVRHLTESDFLYFLGHVHGDEKISTETLRHFYRLCFYSGLRVGEAIYAITAGLEKLRGDVLSVDYQTTRDGTVRLPKNRKRRKTLLTEEAVESFRYLVNATDLAGLDRDHLGPKTKAIAQKLFKNPRKHIVFHDLRHSFAILMLHSGLSISRVAQLIGDRVEICEEYYIGFIANDEALEQASAIIRARSKARPA